MTLYTTFDSNSGCTDRTTTPYSSGGANCAITLMELPADVPQDWTMITPSDRRLNVLLTIDTELSPSRGVATEDEIRANVRGSFYGTAQREGGLPFQLQQLQESGLKAVFFIEALSPLATGMSPLQEVVDLVRSFEQEVQLHIHTEWLALARQNPFGQKTGQNIHEFSQDEQTKIIEIGRNNLLNSGIDNIAAFRAGNYGADNATLRALAANGIRFDSSYNYPYLGNPCNIETSQILTQATPIQEVTEVPVTFFSDRPGHFRHAQLCACSFSEISRMLLQAHSVGLSTFVIVSHSFELINRSRTRANRLLMTRFVKLCRFLSDRRDLFKTVGFNGLEVSETTTSTSLTSSLWRTAGRYAEQLAGRIYE